MVQLVSIDKIRTRTGMGPQSAASPFVVSALTAAQLRIEAELDSVFTQANYIDQFFLDRSIQDAQENGLWKLRLSCGFLRGPPTILQGRAFNSSGIDLVDVADTDVLVKLDKGLVYLSPDITGYVAISYTAGFVPADVPSQIPDWLVDGIIGYYPLVANFSQIQDRPADIQTLTKLNVDHALAVISPHKRPVGGLTPL